MITREQVADLQPGDVVEIRNDEHPGTVVGGPLIVNDEGYLMLGDYEIVRRPDGGVVRNQANLTVVSRAPRPLYVNHPRTEAREHDVVRDGAGVVRHCDAKGFGGKPAWWSWEIEPGFRWSYTTTPPQPLTLLVDGETGQVVPS